ncbi:MAG: deoxyribodipyrimidine photo-lyase [Rhodoferax sp.]|nr:deoxyribodipyrimidine photo-lyase [Rhodoferax sp.]
MSYSVVLFKRDLRLHDHAPLVEATTHGPVLCLYVIDTSLWVQTDAARQHFEFVLESLRELAKALRALGGRLHVRTGEVPEVLAQLQALAQFGVVRGLKDRKHGQSHWTAHIQTPQLPCPEPSALQFQPSPWPAQPVPSAQKLGLGAFDPPQRQRGGRSAGLAMLAEFLNDRCRHYRGGISSPLSAPSACSHLSPYLTFGCLSLREVVQATDTQLRQLKAQSAYAAKGLEAFLSRLLWHCHFIQKLATRAAKDRLHSLRRDPQVRAGKAAIVEKHASRSTQGERAAATRRGRLASTATSTQLSLGFD